jgi:hypothetical protein
VPKLHPTGTRQPQLGFAEMFDFLGIRWLVLYRVCAGIALITRRSPIHPSPHPSVWYGRFPLPFQCLVTGVTFSHWRDQFFWVCDLNQEQKIHKLGKDGRASFTCFGLTNRIVFPPKSVVQEKENTEVCESVANGCRSLWVAARKRTNG